MRETVFVLRRRGDVSLNETMLRSLTPTKDVTGAGGDLLPDGHLQPLGPVESEGAGSDSASAGSRGTSPASDHRQRCVSLPGALDETEAAEKLRPLVLGLLRQGHHEFVDMWKVELEVIVKTSVKQVCVCWGAIGFAGV